MCGSNRERSEALNAAIDTIYDQLAALGATRHESYSDARLEGQIAQLLQRLLILQKQEADLIRAMAASTRSRNVETGVAILERAEQLRVKYGVLDTAHPDGDCSA